MSRCGAAFGVGLRSHGECSATRRRRLGRAVLQSVTIPSIFALHCQAEMFAFTQGGYGIAELVPRSDEILFSGRGVSLLSLWFLARVAELEEGVILLPNGCELDDAPGVGCRRRQRPRPALAARAGRHDAPRALPARGAPWSHSNCPKPGAKTVLGRRPVRAARSLSELACCANAQRLRRSTSGRPCAVFH
jgi:hypothetical protein